MSADNMTVPRAAGRQRHPGVVLLGVDTPIGLAMARELGRAGIDVYGLGRTHRALGKHSRYVTTFDIRASADRLVDQLRNLGTNNNAPFLMTVSEDDILWINRNRDALVPIVPLVPAPGQLERVLDKQAAIRAADAVGIDRPLSIQIETLAALEDHLPGLTYPLVLKWADPGSAHAKLKPLGLRVDKAAYIHSETELKRYLRQFEPAGCFPLIQSYCAGGGLGHMIYMHQGRALIRFQHRRVHEWPPEGGVSSVCVAERADMYPDLMAKSEALLATLGWEGPAMVEYRFDHTTGDAKFMEVNGRFWGSLPLAVHARAGFVITTYRAMGLGDVRPPEPYRTGLKARYMIPETRRLARILFGRQKIKDPYFAVRPTRELARFFLDYLNPHSRYYVWAWDDPLPMLADLWSAVFNRQG
ncbi:MAG: carboxylate--amine ligase [Pseudomonadota bacterium]